MTNWLENNNTLSKTFEFETFEAAMEWMNKASVIISAYNHHPTWTNTYNKVHVQLCTHDAGNIVTEKDQLLAVALDGVQ